MGKGNITDLVIETNLGRVGEIELSTGESPLLSPRGFRCARLGVVGSEDGCELPFRSRHCGLCLVVSCLVRASAGFEKTVSRRRAEGVTE
jgi:hypothetical protein